MPVLATYFSVRRGRDPFFKFFMRTIFPKQVKDYEERFGIRFIGWYNVAHGWDFDNVILLDLPDYATLDKLEDEGRVVFRYGEKVNGSARSIAGIVNDAGNVLGMMPHPERAFEAAHGGTDGRRLFEGLLETVS